MKKILILLLLVIPASSCFAGSFYSNIVVLSNEITKILPILFQTGSIAAYYIIKDNTCVIYEKKLDEQDIGHGLKVTAALSQQLNTTVIYSTNHDSDVFLMYIYKNGKEIFLYNSDPEYFEGEKLLPSMNKVDKLLPEYRNIKKDDFFFFFYTKETFSEDIYYKIAEKLNLPEYSVNYGYNIIEYMDEDELSEMEDEYEIKIEKINWQEKLLEMFSKMNNFLEEQKERKEYDDLENKWNKQGEVNNTENTNQGDPQKTATRRGLNPLNGFLSIIVGSIVHFLFLLKGIL
jgi:hypothetical protein